MTATARPSLTVAKPVEYAIGIIDAEPALAPSFPPTLRAVLGAAVAAGVIESKVAP